MAQSADDELANLRAQRMAQIQAQLEEQAAAQADAEIEKETARHKTKQFILCLAVIINGMTAGAHRTV